MKCVSLRCIERRARVLNQRFVVGFESVRGEELRFEVKSCGEGEQGYDICESVGGLCVLVCGHEMCVDLRRFVEDNPEFTDLLEACVQDYTPVRSVVRSINVAW